MASIVSLDERLVRRELVSHYLTGKRQFKYLRSPSELEIGKFVSGFTEDGAEMVVLILNEAWEPWFLSNRYYYEVVEL